MDVGGRGNFDPGNRWRDLGQIWHGASPHTREGYRLCDYVVGVAGGRGMGVSGRGNIDPGNCWSDLDQIWHGDSLTPGKVIGYVVMWWA